MIRPALFGIITLILTVLPCRAQGTKLKPDEQIVFYPSIATRATNGTNVWRVNIRGMVFEPERRGLLLAAFKNAIELKRDRLSSAESMIFNERARVFLVDHERGKKVFIRIGTNEFFVGESGTDGRFEGEINLRDPVEKRFTAAIRPGDDRELRGQIFPLEAEGVSVISDIDDTIKITEVRDKEATLQNTFLREFRAVPGMAEFYRQLTPSNDVAFHYISASPWQLYGPLAKFIAANEFPDGTFELKRFRLKDRSFFSLFSDPEKYKPSVIEPLLRQFPKRRFILIGDSGERDPEIYGALARKFPEQIIRIYIREVTKEATDSNRYQKAFRDVRRDKWQVFRVPAELNL